MPRRDPNLIDRSRAGTEKPSSDEAEEAVEAEKRRVQGDAAVAKSEVAPALSWVARIIGTAEEARTVSVFIVLIVIVLSAASVLIFTSDTALRASIIDLFGKVLLIGIGYLAGHTTSRRG